MKNIPSEQVTALYHSFEIHGRNTKREIRHAWMTGDYSLFHGVNTSALQCFRNDYGPSVLQRISLASLARNAEI